MDCTMGLITLKPPFKGAIFVGNPTTLDPYYWNTMTPRNGPQNKWQLDTQNDIPYGFLGKHHFQANLTSLRQNSQCFSTSEKPMFWLRIHDGERCIRASCKRFARERKTHGEEGHGRAPWEDLQVMGWRDGVKVMPKAMFFVWKN